MTEKKINPAELDEENLGSVTGGDDTYDLGMQYAPAEWRQKKCAVCGALYASNDLTFCAECASIRYDWIDTVRGGGV